MKSDYKWLDSWLKEIKGKSVLELGAGTGIDTKILRSIASSLIATDLVRNDLLNIEELDHSERLPYESNSFEVVVASLCLHYFDWIKTEEVVSEIYRVLTPGGILIGRVNSKKDANYGATGYPEIESNLFIVNNQAKRFFDKTDLCRLFSEKWDFTYFGEKTIDRYSMPKTILEFRATRA
ncbi:class I SAM-dependent methyltransferase [Microbulbifer elongatus]|uniref:Class I SAM-dependent methyltransferase n=1 Tax=Microbulbifer elongatus TaxID=86173 RepID=A0ABT1P180_9GAMM|nr:class I SAM-dependent methyltransferase [Microbulbifer elongatus]MCQ3829277.1 class I SAM-dependent methyltransferase [Microbulbifer elongatus]